MSRFLFGIIRIYQIVISPLLGPRCRFYPTCSNYALQCLDKYPVRTAVLKTLKRLSRCHPWNPGGVDLP
ncbi:MAG: membrane protein insertion efficiency factor YidD [Pseudobacteriovorax sp.]|nr:membrane protein insertion efficiency factor YidD [Pseudobacteriovorax sp.]